MLDLTQSQLLLWMGQQLNPESPLYNMVLTFDLHGAIDGEHFQQAFQRLIDQCDAMRTVFEVVEEQPRQRVLPQLSYAIEVLDWSDRADAVDHFKSWGHQRSQHHFDLSNCLFDSVLIKISAQRYIWYFNQHHLITDAWAVTVQYKAMAQLYKAISQGEELPAPLPAFGNYVTFERQARQSEQQKPAQQYWEEKAEVLPDPPPLYGRRRIDATSESIRFALDLGVERSNRLRELCSEPDLRAWTQHLSLFNIFSTVLFAYLYRISGQQQLAIGTPAHNRSTAAFKETPGIFIEIFPLLAEVQEDDSFGSLLQRVRNEANYFLRYAQTGASSPNLNRGFNVVLNYINAEFSDFAGIPMQSEWIHPDHADPGHHIRLQVYDFDASGAIQLNFDLNSGVFDDALRGKVAGHFLQMLDSFIEDRSQPIRQPNLLQTQTELFQLSQNGHQVQQQASVLEGFEAQAEQHPEAIALRFDAQSTSYQQLNEQANQLAHYLTSQGVGPGDRVALYLSRRPELLMSIFAVLKTGASYVPIPTNYPEGRVQGIIEDAQAKRLLTTEKLAMTLNHFATPSLLLDKAMDTLKIQAKHNLALSITEDSMAYMMYTSGSTGKPKGVMISHGALSHYIQWAAGHYAQTAQPSMPLFTSIGFDLTVTSIFLPLISGGTLHIYEEAAEGPDLALYQVMEDNQVDLIKLTPSHLALLKPIDCSQSKVKSMIVGGENFKTELAAFVQQAFGSELKIYNEYGPTEVTVGCVVHLYDAQKDQGAAVPIGQPIANTSVYVLDELANPAPQGVAGELYITGKGMAEGYWNQSDLSEEKFLPNPFQTDQKFYRSGDLVRINQKGDLEFLGRKDLQVKIRGRRVELEEIETALTAHPAIQDGVVELRYRHKPKPPEIVHNCTKCGLPSNYPGAEFDDEGVCHLCNAFEGYEERAHQYFKTIADLKAIFDATQHDGEYDCIMLLSGGKDSTYALGQLIEMGLKVLAFTLDNGYISEEALENARRVCRDLGVDQHFGTTPSMNAVFVDSLQRHHNVCDGCFKVIYTLSTQLALEKRIPYIVTGLSRGQFFETRLTEELFKGGELDNDEIDEIVLNARKVYHQVDDAVKQLMDTSMFDTDEVFEKVKFLDFYRYTDVSLDEMLEYLNKRLPWVRPSDTGRSTNCLINQAGIFIHKRDMGYSNYAFPYSWDVRIGHKERQASLDEINEEIDVPEVERILEEIGFTQAEKEARQQHLVAYYVATEEISEAELRNHLSGSFPDYMIPVQFIPLEAMPLTLNGKIDREALPEPDAIRPVLDTEYVAPRNQIEEMLADIWSDLLHLEQVGVYDNFIAIGGDSLIGIRMMSRINEAFELDLPINSILNKNNIAALAEFIESTIMALLEEMDDSETAS
ncbi:MAG: amino acid adenylation domain-containing protein [Bacteroidota bacterium]